MTEHPAGLAPLQTTESVTQFAVLDALLAGTYESGITVEEILTAADFGIGCCDHLGGEVIIVDGEAYECTVDDAPARMRSDEILPFVDACRLPALEPVGLAPGDLTAFTAQIENRLLSRNLFHAVRVDGRFTAVRVRVTPRQEHPARPLAEVTAEQIETVLTEVSGTLVGFWSPAIYQGIAVAGLHLHFLAADRSVGGHILDVTPAAADLRIAAYARFELRLPTDPLFLATELSHDEDHRIVAVEGGARSTSR